MTTLSLQSTNGNSVVRKDNVATNIPAWMYLISSSRKCRQTHLHLQQQSLKLVHSTSITLYRNFALIVSAYVQIMMWLNRPIYNLEILVYASDLQKLIIKNLFKEPLTILSKSGLHKTIRIILHPRPTSPDGGAHLSRNHGHNLDFEVFTEGDSFIKDPGWIEYLFFIMKQYVIHSYNKDKWLKSWVWR